MKLKKYKFSNSLRKMLVTFMSLAFFYLVIGDLITFHQKVLFDFDIFSGQPINKPNKSDKDSLYKQKDKKDRILSNFLTFISEHFEIIIETPIATCVLLDVSIVKDYMLEILTCHISLRGPPQCKTIV